MKLGGLLFKRKCEIIAKPHIINNTKPTEMKYNIENIRGKKYAVSCASKEELAQCAKIIGYPDWSDTDTFLAWDKYWFQGCCISCEKSAYANALRYIEEGFTIIPAALFLSDNAPKVEPIGWKVGDKFTIPKGVDGEHEILKIEEGEVIIQCPCGTITRGGIIDIAFMNGNVSDGTWVIQPAPWQPKVGDLVNVPTTKSIGAISLESVLSIAKQHNAEYLEIMEANPRSVWVRCPNEMWYQFALSDLTPYTPPKPEQEQLWAVCIDDSRSGYELTVGNRYPVTQNTTYEDRWDIINDSNKPDQFHKMHFAAPFTLPKEDKKYCYTSHDGVKMYEGEDVWFIGYDTKKVAVAKAEQEDKYCDQFYFSTQSAAHAWLDEQKKVKEQNIVSELLYGGLDEQKGTDKVATVATELTAKQLQDKKTKVEVEIAEILAKFNQTCVENGFEVKHFTLKIFNEEDENSTFDVDIHII